MQIPVNSVINTSNWNIKKYFLATRPLFFITSLLPVILGTAIGYGLVGQLDTLAFMLALLAVVFVNAGINVLNDVYDDLGGTDRVNISHISPFTGGSRVIQEKILSNAQMRRLGYFLLTLSVIFGTGLALYKGYIVVLYGLIGLSLGVAYSVPPFKLASRGFGESAIVVGVGVLPVTGAAWLQLGQFSWGALLLSIPASLWVANIILINEVPDIDADGATGKRTLVVRIGHQLTAAAYLLLNVLACIAVYITSSFGYLPLAATILPLILLLPAIYAGHTIYYWSDKPERIVAGIKFTIAIHAVGILWLFAWIISMD